MKEPQGDKWGKLFVSIWASVSLIAALSSVDWNRVFRPKADFLYVVLEHNFTLSSLGGHCNPLKRPFRHRRAQSLQPCLL